MHVQAKVVVWIGQNRYCHHLENEWWTIKI